MPTSEDVSYISTVLIATGGDEIDGNSEGTGDFGLSLSLRCCTVGGTTATVPEILKKFGGRIRPLKLGGIIGSCLPKPLGFFGPLEQESIVSNCGSGDATDEILITSLVCAGQFHGNKFLSGVIPL